MSYDNADPAMACDCCGNEATREEIDAMLCRECRDSATFSPMFKCEDCGELSTDVASDSYAAFLCPTCTQRRINRGCEEAERSAYDAATSAAPTATKQGGGDE